MSRRSNLINPEPASNVTRRRFLSGLAAAPLLTVAPAAALQMDACAQATVQGRQKAKELKQRLGITSDTPAPVRCDRFSEFAQDLVRWGPGEVHELQATHYGDGRKVVAIPDAWPVKEQDETFIRFAAILLWHMPEGEVISDVEPVRRLRAIWARRHAFGRSFVREFLG